MNSQNPTGLERPVLVGSSPAIVALRADIAAAARTQAKVLVLGETGAGKEVVARLIHQQGGRANRPFVAVNCSGIPETLLESELFGHVRGSFTGAFRDKAGLVRQADRGTLFLDELGEMSLRMQAALLRFTETGEIQPVGGDAPSGRTDVRLICATNRDLRARIANGAFREDLYYRLNVIQIAVPPLRDRGDDILVLFEYYLTRAAEAHRMDVPTLTPEVARLLLGYQWPGNVRELRNVTERLVLHGSPRPLQRQDLPAEIRDAHSTVVTRHATARTTAIAATLETGTPASTTTEHLWKRLTAGEDFWTVVQAAFKAHEITREDLAALVDRGLQETHGSYRALVARVNLPATDYKRFHAFLYSQRCNLPVQPYRQMRGRPEVGKPGAPDSVPLYSVAS